MKLWVVTATDAAALAAVHAQAFDAPWDDAAFADLLAGPGVFGFLVGEDAPAGLILCRAAAGELEVLTLAVAPAARRRGLARALVQAALDAGRAEAAFLEVAVDNDAAIALYAAAGFRQAGRRKAYYDRGPDGRVDALVMRLDLGPASA